MRQMAKQIARSHHYVETTSLAADTQTKNSDNRIKALTRGRTDHFSTENSANDRKYIRW